MYSALWHTLPGPWWVRLLIVLVLVAAILFVLATWVFPWVDATINPVDVTVDSATPGA